MASAIGHIALPVADRFHPLGIRQAAAVQLGVSSGHPDSSVIDTREIRLACDASPEADIERLIPNVEVVRKWTVADINEIDDVGVGDVHNIFVRTRRIKWRNFIVWQGIASEGEPSSSVRESNCRAL